MSIKTLYIMVLFEIWLLHISANTCDRDLRLGIHLILERVNGSIYLGGKYGLTISALGLVINFIMRVCIRVYRPPGFNHPGCQ